MKYWAVHDRKSVLVVAFLGNNALICENDEKKQNYVSDNILQYLQTKLLGLVKSGKFKRKESTIIWSKHVLYPKRAWTASTEFRLQGFPEPNQTDADRWLFVSFFSFREWTLKSNRKTWLICLLWLTLEENCWESILLKTR